MKRLAAVFAGGATLALATAAEAFPRRVIVAGPAEDVLTVRVQKEINALGFETLRANTGPEACSFQTIAMRVDVTSAAAATCTDGDQISIWVVERSGLRLREVVTVNAADEHANDIAAVRTGEITRASLALREAEEDASRAPPPPPPPFVAAPEPQDRPTAKPTTPPAPRVPAFAGSVGMSSLMGIDASVGTISAQAEVGITRFFALAARLEYPVESHAIDHGIAARTKVSPAFAGAGVDIPVLPSSAFAIPRIGAGAGVTWVRAETGGAVGFDGQFRPIQVAGPGTDSIASPAFYGSAGVSMRLYGPARLVADGVIGATASRIVVRSTNANLAYWGQPFGALSLRLEIMIR